MLIRTETTLARLDREHVKRNGFRAYAQLSWAIAEPTTDMVWDWHADEICEHLEALKRGASLLMCINIAPGTSKSMLCSVLFPAYLWLDDPKARMLNVAYESGLVRDFASKSTVLLQSDWHRARWGNFFAGTGVAKGREALGHQRNIFGGERINKGMGEGITGFHGKYILLDDPLKAGAATVKDDGMAQRALRLATERLSSVIASRKTGPNSRMLLTMQRLAESDPTKWFTDRGCDHLVLPAVIRDALELANRSATRFGGDRRTAVGECLAPKRFAEGRKHWDRVARDLHGWGDATAEAQLQQKPTPPGGNIFKTGGLSRRFRAGDHSDRKGRPGHITIISVDAAFKNTSDPVAIEVVGYDAGEFFTWYSNVSLLTFSETVAEIARVGSVFQPHLVLIEDKANGPAIVDVLSQNTNCRIEAWPADKNKVVRAKAASFYINPPLCRMRYLEGAPWLEAYPDTRFGGKLTNMATFPSSNDHDVDATSQAVEYLVREFGFSEDWGRSLDASGEERREAETLGARVAAMVNNPRVPDFVAQRELERMAPSRKVGSDEPARNLLLEFLAQA